MAKKRARKKRKKKSAKTTLRNKCDRLWSEIVRTIWPKCPICGSRRIEAHHLIGRAIFATRYEIQNGIGICGRHHRLDPRISPHNGSVGFTQWLEEFYPEIYEWVMKHKNDKLPPGTITEKWYEAKVEELTEIRDGLV